MSNNVRKRKRKGRKRKKTKRRNKQRKEMTWNSETAGRNLSQQRRFIAFTRKCSHLIL